MPLGSVPLSSPIAMKYTLLSSAWLGMLAQKVAAQTCVAAPVATSPVGVLVITNVNVADVVAGEVLSYRMVVVQDGCITSIGTWALGGRAVQHLNGRGKYSVPSLWDSYVQAPGEAERERQLPVGWVTRGITSVSYFGNPQARTVRLATVQAIEADERVGPRVALAGSLTGRRAPADIPRNGDLLRQVIGRRQPAQRHLPLAAGTGRGAARPRI